MTNDGEVRDPFGWQHWATHGVRLQSSGLTFAYRPIRMQRFTQRTVLARTYDRWAFDVFLGLKIIKQVPARKKGTRYEILRPLPPLVDYRVLRQNYYATPYQQVIERYRHDRDHLHSALLHWEGGLPPTIRRVSERCKLLRSWIELLADATISISLAATNRLVEDLPDLDFRQAHRHYLARMVWRLEGAYLTLLECRNPTLTHDLDQLSRTIAALRGKKFPLMSDLEAPALE